MLNKQQDKKLTYLNAKNRNTTSVNTVELTSLIQALSGTKGQINTDDRRLKELRHRLDIIIDSFQSTYKELVGYEVKLLNLDNAANNIVDRNDFIDQIYYTAQEEISRQLCQ